MTTRLVKAGDDAEFAGARARDGGRLDLARAAHEAGGMRLAVDGEALPHGAFDRDRDGGDLRIAAEQEVDQLLGVVLHGNGGGLARDRVDGVLHGVGGQDFAVVAVVVRGVKVAGEQYLHGPLAQFVSLGAARDFHQADARFAVAIFSELDHLFSFLLQELAVQLPR